MTPEQQYIQWLDNEIGMMATFENPDKDDDTFDINKLATLRVLNTVKRKFITLFKINNNDKAGDPR